MYGQVPVLRPMNVGDIVDASIRIYRHTFLPLLGIAAIVQVPLQAVGVCVGQMVSHTMLATESAGASAEPPWGQLAAAAGAYLGWLLLIIFLQPLGEAALAIAVSERYLGHPVTIGGAYRAAFPYYGRVLWTSLLFSLFVAGVSIFGCVAAPILVLWVMVRFFLGPDVVVVLENRWGPDALRRGYELTAGYFWSVFAALAILQLMIICATVGIYLAFLFGSSVFAHDPHKQDVLQMAFQATSGTAAILLRPIPMIGAVLIYYDLRIRKEGFDLMMMAEALGRPIAPAAAPAAELPMYSTLPGLPGVPAPDQPGGSPGEAAATDQAVTPATAVPAAALPPLAAEPLLFPTSQPPPADLPPPAPDATTSQETP